MANNKKGIVLFIVLATVLIIVILSGVILSIISSQSRLTHHQASRIKAYYAGKGIMNYALEMLRKGSPGGWVLPGTGNLYYACHKAQGSSKDCVDSGISPTSSAYIIPTDNDIPYNVQVTIHPDKTGPNNIGAKLEIKTEYTYTP
jgi:hypothetical protein